MAGGLALALSGGGAHGAYQVGVLDELITRRGVDFETVVGTSTGAIQAAAVAQDSVDELLDFWTGITGPGDIYRGRGGPIWAVITGKDSLHSVGPLQDLLRKAYKDERIRATGKNLRLAVVNIQTGELQTIAENTDDIADWVLASSAQPPFFPPWKTRRPEGDDEQWVDGGVKDVTPYNAALKLRPRAILAVRAEAPLNRPRKGYDNIIEIGLRSVELLTREVSDNDLGNVELINQILRAAIDQEQKLVEMGLSPAQVEAAMAPLRAEIDRFALIPTMVIEPETNLYETLDFIPELLMQNIERGREAVRTNWSEIASFLDVPEVPPIA
ncbi:MAG: patatin-like phospholipase family protein [Erythrobacter sp.]